MAKIFISHSGKDTGLVDFFRRVFSGTGVTPIFEEFIAQFVGKVTSRKVELDIQLSNAVFVVLSKNAEQIPHTRDWIVWEAGTSKNKDIWVFEDSSSPEHVSIAVPRLTHYVYCTLGEPTLPYVRSIVESYNDQNILTATLLGAGIGASMAKRKSDRYPAAVLGSLAGLVIGATVGTKERPLGIQVRCSGCFSVYSVHLAEGLNSFRCPSCNRFLRFPETYPVAAHDD